MKEPQHLLREAEPEPAPTASDRVREAAERIPSPVRTVLAVASGLSIAGALGFDVGIRAALARILGDPYVYFVVRLLVLAALGAAIAIAAALTLYVTRSVFAWIAQERWVGGVAGVHPQDLHRHANDFEEAREAYLQVYREQRDNEVELVLALERTNDHARRLTVENRELRERVQALAAQNRALRGDEQLELGGGGLDD